MELEEYFLGKFAATSNVVSINVHFVAESAVLDSRSSIWHEISEAAERMEVQESFCSTPAGPKVQCDFFQKKVKRVFMDPIVEGKEEESRRFAFLYELGPERFILGKGRTAGPRDGFRTTCFAVLTAREGNALMDCSAQNIDCFESALGEFAPLIPLVRFSHSWHNRGCCAHSEQEPCFPNLESALLRAAGVLREGIERGKY